MTTQERVEADLQQHSGLFLCAACLAREAGVTPAVGRAIAWTVQALPGYQMRGAKCGRCLRGKRSIRFVGGYSVAGASARIAVFLLKNADIYLCDACLAFASENSLADVRRVAADLASLHEFDRRESTCNVCERDTTVTATTCSADDAQTSITHTLTKSVPYHGWRIDLFSYGTSGGWRPFVVMKGLMGTAESDAPSVLSHLLPSKVEADHEALTAAKTWIDSVAAGRQVRAFNVVA